MKSSKLLAMVLVGSLTISAGAIPIRAAEITAEPVQSQGKKGVDTSDITTEKLTKITEIVKSKITLPKKFTEFNYEYNQNSETGELYYDLIWNKENNEKNSIQVICDEEGHIILYVNEIDQKDSYIPNYKKNQLQGKVESFLKTVMPDSIGKIQFSNASIQSIYSGTYCYTYERVENEIPVPENSIEIEVNYDTGDIVSLQSNWEYGLSIPSQNISISEKEAKEKIKEKLKMNLSYHDSYVKGKDGKSKKKIFLAYSPDLFSLAVDAVSGKLYTTKGEKESEEYSTSQAKAGDSYEGGNTTVAAGSSLTEQEIKKIDEISNIISAKEAVAVIKDENRLFFDKNATKVTTKLYQKKNSEGKNTGYQWNIDFSLPKEKEDQSGWYYATAKVDAKTGKILSYYSYYPNPSENKDGKAKYTKAQAAKQMEAFFSSQLPEYLKQCTSPKEVSDEYLFHSYRTYKNIGYQENGIYGAMDRETGKIYSFSYHWDESAVFEEPENLISEQAAEDAYLDFDGFQLIYEINWKNRKPEVRLVYRTNIEPAYVSPFTGKQLKSDGTEYKASDKIISYQDIKDSYAKESIELLADMGLGFYGGFFYPKKAITVEEWKMLAGETLSSYENNQILKKWDVWNNENKTITRLDAAKYCVIVSGLNKAAVLPDTYQITYQDKDKIAQADAGYVMLVKGLKLLEGDSENNFNPNAVVTREEAAQIIMNLIKQK